MGNWPESWIQYWLSQGDIADLTATIVIPSEGQQFQQGQKVTWSINYEGTVYFIFPVFWNEEGLLDTSTPGAKLLFSKYGAGGDSVRMYVVKKKPTLGTKYNQYDDVIIAKGTQYTIPSDLLKSLIHQEAIIDKQEQTFVTNSYRYEAHKDYDWYSGPNSGDYIFVHPNHHFTIAGKDTRQRTIPPGDQLPSNYLSVAQGYSFLPLDLTDTIKDKDLTAAELVANNPKQNWESRPDWNFTAQLVLAASYGLGQVMYETALVRGFDTTDTAQPARDVHELFEPEVSIDLSAKHLKKKYDENGQDWWQALFYYNGGFINPDPNKPDSEDYADSVMKTWTSGIYKLITE